MSNQLNRLKEAERGVAISIGVYILLSFSKISIGFLFHASSLMADGVNNISDAISSIAVLIGLKTSRRPADQNHPYGHWKAEAIASLVTSFLMVLLGVQLFIYSLQNILSTQHPTPNLLAGIVALISTLIMLFLYYYNRSLALKTHSSGLSAVAKDNFADALTSLSTGVAIIAASFGYGWIDYLMAIIVSCIILKTGVDIAIENMFSLSDGFSKETLETYKNGVLTIDGIDAVADIKGRMYGTHVYVDITIAVNGQMTVQKSHDLTEQVESYLYHHFDVCYVDVHVEPTGLHI